MAAITISSTKPAELGTAVITLYFTDEDGANVTPTDCCWQLMRPTDKTNATVINDRTFALCTFEPEAITVDSVARIGKEITISGDDLAVFGSSDSCQRVFSAHGVYDTDKTINAEIRFEIDRLYGQVDVTT
jgi:hypothetical protein